MAKQISKPDKTSLVIDREKLEQAREILGTSTIAETVDAALQDVIAFAARRRAHGDGSSATRRDRVRARRSCAASASR